MSSHALTWTLLHGRGTRAFFLARPTQPVRSATLARELARAAVALGGLAAWGAVCALLVA